MRKGKIMKKIFSVILAGIMSVSICACKSGTMANETGETSNFAGAILETSNADMKIKDYAVGEIKDQEDQTLKVITVYCEYKNTGRSENSMSNSAEITAFQNGVELKATDKNTTTPLLYDDIKESDSDVKRGESYTTYYNFILEDETSPVKVRITSGVEMAETTYALEG
jgi:hypothetical protein